MEIERRRLAAYALVALLVLGAGIAVAAHITGTVPISDGVTLQAPDGMTVNVTGSTDALLEEPFTTSGTVYVQTEAGNASFFSSGSANATVAASDLEGTFTNVTSIDADPNSITIDPDDKDSAIVAQEVTAFAWRSGIAEDDGTVDFVYTGAAGQSEVTVQGVTANTELFAVDAATNDILDNETSTGGGAITFDSLDSGTHDVEIRTNENNDPVLSNARPQGNVDSTFSQFQVDVNDSEFARGDSVTAELTVDGTVEGSDTLSSNGTASVSFNPDLGTTYTYNWTARDSFGGVNTTGNLTVSTPGNLTIRNETNASEIITGVDATVTFYSADATTVVERTDTNNDGNISLTGLPDKEFVVVMEVDGFYERRAYIESIYDQQDLFVLNQSAVPGDEAVNTTFVFEDRTGNFDPENTTLRVQRALDVNNDSTFEWMTVAGDFWGAASEFPFTGQENARYRLVVENQDGDRRVLGTHIPVADGTKEIINGEIRFDADNATGRYFDANLSESDENIQVLYQDPTDKTQDIRVRIWELGNRSNVIHDQNYTNSPYGRLFTTVSLTSDQASDNWVVKIDSTHSDDGAIDLQVTVGGVGIPLPIDPWLLASFGVIGLTFVGTLYGPRTALLGSWMLVISGMGLTAFGWVDFPFAALIVALCVAAGGTLYREALPG